MSDPNILEKSDIELFTAIMGRHIHPIETAKAPDWLSRRAAAHFTADTDITDGENLVLGAVTYTFVDTLGSPAANNVHIKIQANIKATVQKAAEAIRGVTDTANIAYGTGTAPHPTITAYWTSVRFAIQSTQIAAGQNLFILEKAEDLNTPITFTTTTDGTLTAFTRDLKSRYVFNGNHATDSTQSITGDFQCLLPIGSVLLGGQAAPGGLVAYDPHLITMTAQSDTSEKEVDVYYSFDEVTFIRTARSIPFSSATAGSSIHVQTPVHGNRIPKGAGMYIRARSAGTGATATADFNVSYHLYPVNLSR